MNIPANDPKAIVAHGYDAIAERYLTWAMGVRVAERGGYMEIVLNALPDGAAVLELGCGAGIPITQRLAERFTVTGVDLSTRQIELARRNVPTATFLHGDMTQMDFAPASFDGVCAFYAITHVPREEHAAMLGKIATWLRPNGLFVASFSHGGSDGEIEADWLGAPMYFSGFDAETNRRLVTDAGLTIEIAQAETDDEFGKPATFFWIVARKPRDSGERE
ncbi:MAG: methyltransferase domain-containing protein [Chloroflexota bacterium]|nr:methyltransferase domain-containing protein [Chloroflexota bacterium]